MPACAPPFEDPRAVLKRHGLAPKKSWGQNFLVSRSAVERIARLCVDEPGRHVVEIGAGLGTLTAALLGMGARVTAVERDPDMCAVLEAELGGVPGFALAPGDAATFDYAACLGGARGVVAGNLPYQITGRILRRVLQSEMPLVRAVFMVQAEVADRLCAPPGARDRAALSAMTQARCRPGIVVRLPPTAFSPRPRVRSAVVDLVPLEAPLYGDLGGARFDRAVKAAFASRRKMIRNSLLTAGAGSREQISELLARSGIDPETRAERLPNATLVALATAVAELGSLFPEAEW